MNFIISLIFASLQVFGFEITEINENRGVASVKGDNIHLEEKLFVSNTNGDICKAEVIKKQNNKVLVSTKNCSFRIGKGNKVSAYEGQIASNMNSRKSLRARGRRPQAKKRRGVYHGLELQLGFERDQRKISGIQNGVVEGVNGPEDKLNSNEIQIQANHSLLFGHFEPFYFISYETISGDRNEMKLPGTTTYGGGIGLNYNFINLLKRRKKAPLVPYIRVGGAYKKEQQNNTVQITPDVSLLSVFGGIGGKYFITRRTAINIGISYNHTLNISKSVNGQELTSNENEKRNSLGVTAALLVYL